MAVNLHITGIPELDRELARLSKDVAKKASRSALQRGMTVLANAFKSQVGQALTSGHSLDAFIKSMKGRQQRQKKTGIVSAKVGIAVGRGQFQLRNWQVFHLLTLGTQQRTTGWKRIRAKVAGKWKWTNRYRRTGNPERNTGRMRQHFYVRKGYASAWPTALAVMLQAVQDTIAREAGKKP